MLSINVHYGHASPTRVPNRPPRRGDGLCCDFPATVIGPRSVYVICASLRFTLEECRSAYGWDEKKGRTGPPEWKDPET